MIAFGTYKFDSGSVPRFSNAERGVGEVLNHIFASVGARNPKNYSPRPFGTGPVLIRPPRDVSRYTNL